LQRLIDQQAKTQTMPPGSELPPGSAQKPSGGNTAEPTTTPPRETPPRETPPAQEATRQPAPTTDANAGRTKRLVGIALIGVGAVAISTGIVLSVLAKQAADDIRADAAAGRVFDPGKESQGKAFDVAGPVMDVIGGAAAVSGAVLLVLGLRERPRARAAVPS